MKDIRLNRGKTQVKTKGNDDLDRVFKKLATPGKSRRKFLAASTETLGSCERTTDKEEL